MDVITGSSGFLGSHLLKVLPDATCIPHSAIASSQIESFRNFYFLSSYGNMSWHTDIDAIIKANVLDVIHVLKNIKWHNVHSFIYVSSSSVKRKVQTPYSRAKQAAEEILLSYIDTFNAPITIVRPLSITGVGEQKEHLIPTLIRSALEGTKMPFVPMAYHDFIDVSDVVSGMMTLAEKQARGVFELGTGISRSNLEVKNIVEKITGKTVFVDEVKTLRSYDSSEWVRTDFSAEYYGWKPKKTLEQSIKEMVKAYEN